MMWGRKPDLSSGFLLVGEAVVSARSTLDIPSDVIERTVRDQGVGESYGRPVAGDPPELATAALCLL
jgi:hypothetical protein